MEMTHPIPPRLSTQHSEESEESLAQTNLGHWEYGLKPREIKAEEWGQHAQNFRILYLTDGLKLDDVRRLMYTEHGFYATEAQYKYRLKTIWKIQKTIPKRKILAMLQIEHRRLQGPGKKLTLFYWHGKPVDKNHLERSRNRLRFSGADDVSVETPSYASYRTETDSSHTDNGSEISLHDKSESRGEFTLDQPLVTPTLPLSPIFSEEEPRSIRTHEPNNPSNMRPAPADTDISKTPQLQDYETLFGDCINYPSSSDESSDSFHGFGLLSEESGSTITLRREQYHRVLDSHRRMEVDNESFNIPAITTTGELAVTPPPSPPTSLEQADIDNDLGDTFYDAGHFRDAIGAYESALAKREGALGRQHASTLSILYSMGLSYFQLGDSEKAREHLLQVLEAQESILSEDHPATLLTLQDLGRMCYENGDYEAGQKWYERTLAVQKKVLGNDDLRTLDTVHLLGFICYQRKDYEQGRGYFSRALTGRAKLLGGGHSLTLTSVRSLGLALWQQHKYREALNWYEYALVEQRNQLKNSAATSKQLERSFMDTLFSTCLLCCQLGYRTKVREFLELSYFRGLGNVEAEVLAARKYDTALLKGALFEDTKMRDRPQTYEDAVNIVQVGGLDKFLMSPFWRLTEVVL